MDTETKHSWSWFISYLIADLNVGTGEGLTVMSDMQKVLFIQFLLFFSLVLLLQLLILYILFVRDLFLYCWSCYQMLRKECVLDIYGVIGMLTGKEKKEGNSFGDAQRPLLKSSLVKKFMQCLS